MLLLWFTLNDEDYEVKLNFKEYYRDHFLFQTLRNLTRIKIGNKIFRLIKLPKKDMKKHVHYKNPDLYPLLLQGRRIYDAWKEDGLFDAFISIPSEILRSHKLFINYFYKYCKLEPEENYCESTNTKELEFNIFPDI
ncbi:MAG: hypothetical protein CEE43_11695 [Promethearchaeota archaeon Loki_b32]|nr:MAG: hypothetical protein CEE43_11695 [Candidatus Lokiarchaeota archaeon Loki_b32]